MLSKAFSSHIYILRFYYYIQLCATVFYNWLLRHPSKTPSILFLLRIASKARGIANVTSINYSSAMDIHLYLLNERSKRILYVRMYGMYLCISKKCKILLRLMLSTYFPVLFYSINYKNDFLKYTNRIFFVLFQIRIVEIILYNIILYKICFLYKNKPLIRYNFKKSTHL